MSWRDHNFRVLLAHPGTQHSFHLARELDRRGFLDSFYTGIAFRRNGWLARTTRTLIASKRIANRTLPPAFSAEVHQRPWIELMAQWRLVRGGDEQEIMQRRNDAFQTSISTKALQAVDAVIGVDTAGAILAERCKHLNVPFVLDQSIGHPDAKQAMHDEIRARFPEWSEGFEKRRLEVRAAELKEQTDAAIIVAATTFTKNSLRQHGVPAEKIHVIPYGVDAVRFSPARTKTERPFRFVFIGLVTARKGIPLLLQAWKQLKAGEAELWIIGPTSETARRLIPDLTGLQLFGPVSNERIPSLLQECDVLVFPSFFEGFGLVLLEAMASGLPVITTSATAGLDVVTQNEDGWVLDPGDLDALVSTMQVCLGNRARVEEMGRNAWSRAQQFPWERYGAEWAKILAEVVRDGRVKNEE